MTDHEIIKTLEGMINKYNSKFSDEVLDLINRQKAEIERLKGSVIVNNIMESQKIKREAKTEAIKEFAERLKEKSFKTIRNYGLTKDVVEVCDIDNLVKEMVGGKE